MPSLRLVNFQGLKPRENRQLLNATQATIAENVKLWHGTLQAFHEPKGVDSRGAPNQTIYLTGAGWLSYPGIDDFIDGLPGCQRVIGVGEDFSYPVWATAENAITGQWKRLGLPVPGAPNPQSLTDKPSWAFPNDRSSEYHAYVITYVDSFGNEGPSSEVSARIGVDDNWERGNADETDEEKAREPVVSVNLPALPEGDWDIAVVRLYRIGGSDANETQVDNPHAVVFSLVAELSPSTNIYIDSVRNLDLGEPLVSESFLPPPENLTHLVAEPGGIQLAGAVGHTIVFCEPHEFQAWPEKYAITLDNAVTALAWTPLGLYVATTGYPYWISPHINKDNSRDVRRLTELMPCVSRRSMTPLPSGGAVYASARGMVALNDQGVPHEITQNYWADDDFQALAPETMIATAWNGYLFAFTPGMGWTVDLNDSAYLGAQEGLVTLTLRPTAIHRGRDGKLYLALPEGIAEWDADEDYLPWRYRTKLTATSYQANFAAAKVIYESYPYLGTWREADTATHFRLLTDDRECYARDVKHSNHFRLPRLSLHFGFEIELSRGKDAAKGEIREIRMASSVLELTEQGSR